MFLKSNLRKILCLFLSVTLSLSLLGGCKKKPAQNSSSQPTSSQEEVTSQETESEVESEETESEVESEETESEVESEEEIPSDETEDYEDFEDTESTEPEDDETIDDDYDYYDEFDQYNVKFEVYNSQEPLSTEYRGVSSSIYHAFGFMKDQYDGRVYNDKMMDLELDRLVDSGIKFARTRYDSRWAWDQTAGKYDWNKNRFQYFLDYAEELQKRDVNIAIQLGWEFNALVYNESNHPLGEVDYLLGRGNDVYGENKGVDFTGKTEEETRLIKAANRMGYWIAETIKQAKAQRGINNITHLFYFTEPSGASVSKSQKMEGEEAEEYVLVSRTIKDKLAAEGVASKVKHVGPNQGYADQGANLLNYVITKDPDLFDIWTAHAYPKAETVLNNVYYDMLKPICDINTAYVKDAMLWDKTEFWWDELHTQAVDLGQKDGSPWLGLQQVVCYLAAQHAGVDNINMWQIFDQLFTDYLGADGGEFYDGIHMVGTAPSLFKSSIPRPQYYFTSLFSKYHGYQNGTVYQTNNDFVLAFADVFIGVVELENGDYTITVVNVGVDDVNFEVLFDKAINKNLYRHRVNANDVVPTTKAQLAPADATFVDVKDKFKDVVRGGDMIIYTSIKGN